MKHTLSVREYQPPGWKLLAIISLIIAVILLGASWITSNTLWVSIFQLVAFAAFAGTVMAFFQFRGKPKQIILKIDTDHLTIHYEHENKKLKEELFERDTIKKIENYEVVYWWDFFSMIDGYKYIISFTDTTNKLSVFTFSGQNVHISPDEVPMLDDFLNDHNLSNVKK